MRARWVFLLFLLPAGVFAAERELSPVVIGPASGSRSGLQAAASARAVLSVWIDGRSGGWETLGMLVDHEGDPLRARSFRIASPALSYVKVASDGRDFLVAGSNGLDRTIAFVLVREDGGVVPLPGRAQGTLLFSLVFTGGHYVLLHLDRGDRLACTIVNRSGEVLRDTVVIVRDRLYFYGGGPQMATDGADRMLIFWSPQGDTNPHGRVFTVAQLLAPDFAPVTSGQAPEPGVVTLDYAVASNGSEYLLVRKFVETAQPLQVRLQLRRLDRNGQPIGTATVLPFDASTDAPQPVWAGSHWLLAGYPQRNEAVRVSVAGSVLDPAPLRLAAPTERIVAAVAVEGGVWIAWEKFSSFAETQFFGDVVLASGARVRAAGVLLSAGATAQHSAALAACGDSTFAAVWTESTDVHDIRSVRLAIDGRQLGPIVTVREVRAGAGIACSGADAVVVWSERANALAPSRVYASVIGADHVVRPPVDIGAGSGTPAIAWNGEQYLVAYARDPQLMLAPLDRGGRPVGAPVPLRDLPVLSPSQAVRDGLPSLVVHGRDYFLAWLQNNYSNAPTPFSYHSVRAIRLGPSLARVSAIAELPRGAFPGGPPVVPSVAASPHGTLVVWDRWTSFSDATVQFARFDPSGTRLDPPEGRTLGPGTFAAVTWSGSAYEVAAGDRIYTVAPDGSFSSRRGPVSGRADSFAFPLLLFSRPEPVDASPRLWVTPTTAPGLRRRASR